MLARHTSQTDRTLRSYTTYLNEPNILAHYRPTIHASPLKDPLQARIFCHFVTCTGPALSIFERHPLNPTALFSGRPVPASHQGLWTYIIPTMALSSQCLLHAVLALSSLHISKLQQTPPTPSLKHYAYALRKIGKAVGSPTRRSEVTTFAATLLLAFYEVMSAEHSKWNSHLAGAKQLAVEVDFAVAVKQIRSLRSQALTNKNHRSLYGYSYAPPYALSREMEDALLTRDIGAQNVDEKLVSACTGHHVDYDHHGAVIDEHKSRGYQKVSTLKDLEMYETRRDLQWWYLKQDTFQSMISGNRLL